MLPDRIQIERDSNNRKIEDAVYAKLAEIVKPHTHPSIEKTITRFVGVEDALKELLELEKISQGI